MSNLPTEFKKNGFAFCLMVEVGNIRIYEKRSISQSNVVVYELIRVKIEQGAETYPKSSEWGKDGFTFRDFDTAQEALSRLAKNPEKSVVSVVKQEPRKAHKRGRKLSDVVVKFPDTVFTVKEVAASNKVEISFVHNRLNALISLGKAEKVDTKKVTQGRGKPTNFYQLTHNGE